MRIILQFPEGLKREALKYQEKYEKEGHEVFIASAPCYGGCDLPLDEARWIKADKIVHFGHAKFVKKELPIEVEYIPYNIDVNLEKIAETARELRKYKNISLATTVQHLHQFEAIRKIFESQHQQVFAEKGYWAINIGQVLGCDSLALKAVDKKVDAIIFVGDGMFHALAIDFDTNKPVLVIHPQTGQLSQINNKIEKLKKRRKGSILAALDAKTFGILVSTKVGQFYLDAACKAKHDLEKYGKKALLLVSNEIEPLPLNNFMLFDCYVNTACPRLVDDMEEFGKPILNLIMLKEVFGIWEKLKDGG